MDVPRLSRHPHRSHRSRDRSRSHSPHNSSSRRHHRRDSRSHSKDRDSRHRRHRHHHRRHKRTRSCSPSTIALPLNAPPISRHDFELYRDTFADYLDIQKGLILADLDRAEAKGRFRSFVNHYNRGGLARGWYDRIVNKKVRVPETVGGGEVVLFRPEKKQRTDTQYKHNDSEAGESSDDEDDIVGPLLPAHQPGRTETGTEMRSHAPGPTIPSKEDLDLQQEQLSEDLTLQHLDLHYARRQERKLEKERLEELVPRAAAGSHERKLEKKAEVNARMHSFREKSPDPIEVSEETLMGSGGGAGGGTDSFKLRKAAIERKKNDRELRKEQLLRARIAEREERLQQHRDKEEKTMAMLKQLASRFND